MKITFIGTSHGVPAADRFCSCAMIEVGESYILLMRAHQWLRRLFNEIWLIIK